MSLPNPHLRWAVILTLLVALLPAVLLGSFVARWGVKVPMLDDWEMAPLIVKAHTGTLTWADLFAQQEEARTIVPKVIFILSSLGGEWDVREQMLLSVVICALTVAGLYLLLRRSRLGVAGTAICLWVSALLIFSPAQFELWLFASGFPSFLPVLFIVAAWLVLEARWGLGWRFGVAAGLAVLSTFTLAHGMLAWGLTFPLYLLGGGVRRWGRWLLGWTAAAGLCVAAYFYGYAKPAHLPEFGPVIPLLDYGRFFVAFQGGSFAYAWREQPVMVAEISGTVLVLLFTLAAVWWLVRWKQIEERRAVLPWVALALYALGSGALATLGRVGYGIPYAISSRYVTFSLYLVVSLVVLVALWMREIWRVPAGWRLRVISVAMCAVLLAAGVSLYVGAFGRTVRFMHSMSARHALARVAIVFSPVIDNREVIRKFNYPAPERALEFATPLHAMGLLQPPLVQSQDITPLQRAEGSGAWEELAPGEGETMQAAGWAVLPGRRKPVDAVLLAYETPEREWIAFAISDAVVRRRDVARRLREPDLTWCGWAADFPRGAVPAGARLSAWAVATDGPRLYRLPDSLQQEQSEPAAEVSAGQPPGDGLQ
ncbi:hypothetical protein BH20VER1_BH20VER1_21080 [soil metagenome]